MREELLRGHWTGVMPGGPALSKELGIDGKTVWAALNLLEEQGILQGQGAGKRRKITLSNKLSPPTLRVAILDYEPFIATEEWCVSMQNLLRELRVQILHPCQSYCPRSPLPSSQWLCVLSAQHVV